MKKKALVTKLSLNKKTIATLQQNDAGQIKGGGGNSINVCQLSRINCEPSWDTGCISHLSGCPLCPTWPTACDM